MKSKFFEIEADEGADSDEGRTGHNYKNGSGMAIKDAYYEASDLKRKNKGLDEKIIEMEKIAKI